MSKKQKPLIHPENLIPGDKYNLQYLKDGMLTINAGTFLEFYSRLEDDPKAHYSSENESSSPTPHGFKTVLYLKFKKFVRGTDNKTAVEYFHVPYKTIKEIM